MSNENRIELSKYRLEAAKEKYDQQFYYTMKGIIKMLRIGRITPFLTL